VSTMGDLSCDLLLTLISKHYYLLLGVTNLLYSLHSVGYLLPGAKESSSTFCIFSFFKLESFKIPLLELSTPYIKEISYYTSTVTNLLYASTVTALLYAKTVTALLYAKTVTALLYARHTIADAQPRLAPPAICLPAQSPPC